MEKSDVIKMRNTLKAGKNLPLRVYIDNTFLLINEANALQFTKWDDENGILYNYSLTNPIKEQSPSNNGGTITLFAVPYEHIQAMEVSVLNLNLLGESIDSIGTITPEWKTRIIQRFTSALNPDLVNYTARDINKAMGVVDGHKALNDNDEYYENRFKQSFAETVYPNRYNKANGENNKTNNSVETNEVNTDTTEHDVENTENNTEGE